MFVQLLGGTYVNKHVYQMYATLYMLLDLDGYKLMRI